MMDSVCVPNNGRVSLPSAQCTTERINSDRDLNLCCAVDVDKRYVSKASFTAFSLQSHVMDMLILKLVNN